ncbi:plasmid mobilization protein [Gudongella sp. SC589]|jgi:predicted transcriptional regulator|uniref:plasmid mobilization protein n=1 Tax=Gudongella sp. SC589 TaxID=3385990 RepID=UPI0039049CC7
MARSERIYIRVTEEEKEKLQKLADKDHRSISDYIRVQILKEEQQMEEYTYKIMMDGQFMGEHNTYEEAAKELRDLGYKEGAEYTGTFHSENGVATADIVRKHK